LCWFQKATKTWLTDDFYSLCRSWQTNMSSLPEVDGERHAPVEVSQMHSELAPHSLHANWFRMHMK